MTGLTSATVTGEGFELTVTVSDPSRSGWSGEAVNAQYGTPVVWPAESTVTPPRFSDTVTVITVSSTSGAIGGAVTSGRPSVGRRRAISANSRALIPIESSAACLTS